MLMAVDGPYALMVQPDDILISPREVDEHFGTMVCFHSRYALGDSHNYMDKDDFLREMYLDTSICTAPFCGSMICRKMRSGKCSIF